MEIEAAHSPRTERGITGSPGRIDTSMIGQASETAPTLAMDVGEASEQMEKLAVELESRGFAARVCPAAKRLPKLRVINPEAPVLTEEIHVALDSDGVASFFFPWPQRIAPVNDVLTAAGRIERVLAEAGR